jgi:hypothetical protein
MSHWTPERRARQAALIRRWRPWEHSTGPRTTKDKARISMNAYKGRTRELLRELARQLKRQLQTVAIMPKEIE